jgi:hypothetical protein
MAKRSDLEIIKQMLSSGRLTIPDPDTGFHRALYSHCPKGKHDCSVHRIDRSGVAITQVVFRCPICTEQFIAGPEKMFLR